MKTFVSILCICFFLWLVTPWRSETDEAEKVKQLYAEAMRRCESLAAELDAANSELTAAKSELAALRPPKQIVPDAMVGQDAPPYLAAGWLNGEPSGSRVVVLDLWAYS